MHDELWQYISEFIVQLGKQTDKRYLSRSSLLNTLVDLERAEMWRQSWGFL